MSSIDGHLEETSHAADIARAITLAHKRLVGKGPERVQVGLVGDAVVCLLEGGYTQAENALTRRGRSEQVVSHRHVVQHELRDEFVQAIEAVLKRRVRSFMSATDPDQDVQAEIFVLERPRVEEG
jgi:uncharacterized protein YbcI